jgi:predicted RND superfamily exporter protein
MERLTRFSLAQPRKVLGALFALTLFFAAGLPRVRAEYGYQVLIGADHPAILATERMIDTFGGGQPMRIAWDCGPSEPCAHALDSASVELSRTLTNELASMKGVHGVYSPSNTGIMIGDELGFSVRRLVEYDEVVEDLEELAVLAFADPDWTRMLVSDDGTMAMITVQAVDTDIATSEFILDAMEPLLEAQRAAGFHFSLAGDAVASVIQGRALDRSISQLIPALVVVIGLILALLARSWRVAAVALLTMGIALLWTFGLLGWLGWPEDGILEVLAPLVLVVGVCDSVHLLRRVSEHQTAGRDVRDALVVAAGEVGGSCVITTATTGAALLSFAASNLDTFVRFGCIATVGVVVCLALSFTLLPILVTWLPPPIAEVGEGRAWETRLAGVIRFVERNARPIVALALAVLVAGASGARYLRVDTDWAESIGVEEVTNKWLRRIEGAFGGFETLEIVLELPAGRTIEDPQALHTIAAIGSRVSTIEDFAKPASLAGPIERLNRLLHASDPAYERVGSTAAENAELIEMIAFDHPDLLSSWLSLDRRTTRISIVSSSTSMQDQERFVSEAVRIAEALAPEDWTVTANGEVMLEAAWVRDVMSTQVRSFPIALGIVFVLVSVFLRSLRLGLIALVPTLLPVAATLGSMGWLGMNLDVGRAMVAAIVIGIGVDDAIHLLCRYRALRERGDTVETAMRDALLATGPAIVTTSAALAVGFLTLRWAAWATISSFGLLVSLAIVGALVATLVVLPAIVFASAVSRDRATEQQTTPEAPGSPPRG